MDDQEVLRDLQNSSPKIVLNSLISVANILGGDQLDPQFLDRLYHYLVPLLSSMHFKIRSNAFVIVSELFENNYDSISDAILALPGAILALHAVNKTVSKCAANVLKKIIENEEVDDFWGDVQSTITANRSVEVCVLVLNLLCPVANDIPLPPIVKLIDEPVAQIRRAAIKLLHCVDEESLIDAVQQTRISYEAMQFLIKEFPVLKDIDDFTPEDNDYNMNNNKKIDAWKRIKPISYKNYAFNGKEESDERRQNQKIQKIRKNQKTNKKVVEPSFNALNLNVDAMRADYDQNFTKSSILNGSPLSNSKVSGSYQDNQSIDINTTNENSQNSHLNNNQPESVTNKVTNQKPAFSSIQESKTLLSPKPQKNVKISPTKINKDETQQTVIKTEIATSPLHPDQVFKTNLSTQTTPTVYKNNTSQKTKLQSTPNVFEKAGLDNSSSKPQQDNFQNSRTSKKQQTSNRLPSKNQNSTLSNNIYNSHKASEFSQNMESFEEENDQIDLMTKNKTVKISHNSTRNSKIQKSPYEIYNANTTVRDVASSNMRSISPSRKSPRNSSSRKSPRGKSYNKRQLGRMSQNEPLGKIGAQPSITLAYHPDDLKDTTWLEKLNFLKTLSDTFLTNTKISDSPLQILDCVLAAAFPIQSKVVFAVPPVLSEIILRYPEASRKRLREITTYTLHVMSNESWQDDSGFDKFLSSFILSSDPIDLVNMTLTVTDETIKKLPFELLIMCIYEEISDMKLPYLTVSHIVCTLVKNFPLNEQQSELFSFLCEREAESIRKYGMKQPREERRRIAMYLKDKSLFPSSNSNNNASANNKSNNTNKNADLKVPSDNKTILKTVNIEFKLGAKGNFRKCILSLFNYEGEFPPDLFAAFLKYLGKIPESVVNSVDEDFSKLCLKQFKSPKLLTFFQANWIPSEVIVGFARVVWCSPSSLMAGSEDFLLILYDMFKDATGKIKTNIVKIILAIDRATGHSILDLPEVVDPYRRLLISLMSQFHIE